MDPAAKQELEAMQFLKPINEATEQGDSDVQRFYKDAVVFITGGTGFIGKQLLEKLFRSCDLKKAFILTRPKKGKSTSERLQDILSDPVFAPVRMKKPDVASRIVCVKGDLADIRLGISDDDWNTIIEEVDIIFHVAATIKFDENIRTAAITNVRGTREALTLGKACKKLRSYVHVSTAYSAATIDRTGREVREQFYKSPVPADTLLTLVETVDENRLGILTQSLISGWPNTYTFTKAIAEELVQAESGNLPVCIVRPSIVLGTYREPVPGWLDAGCVYGPTAIPLGTVMGVLRVFPVDNTLKISIVPVDLVNNVTIAAGWHTGLRGLQEPLVYNITTSRSRVTFQHLSVPVDRLCRKFTPPGALWYNYLLEIKNRRVFWFLSWILHYIPAYTTDAVLDILKVKKPPGLKSIVHQYTKIDKLSAALFYFAMNEWNFDDTNVQNLWKKMSDVDRTIYNFDIDSIDWDQFTIMWVIGIRKYIIKDGLKGTAKAVARQKWLKLANYAVLSSYVIVPWIIFRHLSWVVRLLLNTSNAPRLGKRWL